MSPAAAFIKFQNNTEPWTVVIDPQNNDNYAGDYKLTFTVTDNHEWIDYVMNIKVLKMQALQTVVVVQTNDQEVNITKEETQEESTKEEKKEDVKETPKENPKTATVAKAKEEKEEDEKKKKALFKPPKQEVIENDKIIKKPNEDFIPPPVRLKIVEITRNGFCRIHFN